MANEYLTRKPTSTGNRKVFTFSCWAKLGSSTGNALFAAGDGTSGNRISFEFDSGQIRFVIGDGSFVLQTSQVLRDTSSLYHFVCAVDTTQVTSQKSIKIFINGVEQTNFSASSFPTRNLDTFTNTTNIHVVGARYRTSVDSYYNGYISDVFMIDGQALTPDVFGFYKEGKGYISAGSTQATDFRPGQWVPKTPRVIKAQIERNGGFGVNGFYLPMNDSSNFGADFHCETNSIITLKGEDLPQPRNGAPETTDAYVSQLRADPYAANLVLAVPGILGAPGVAYTDFSANIKGSGTNKVITANGAAGVAVTASYYGSAMSFTGVAGTYFSGPTNDSDFQLGSGDFTVEAWVYPTSYGANEGIVGVWESSAGRSWLLYNNSTLKPSMIIDGDGAGGGEFEATSGIGITTGQWTHLAGERNGSTLSIYVNGVATGIVTNVSGSVYTNTSNPLDIGRFNSANEFEGYIQDVRVYKGVAKYKGGFDVPKPYTPVGIATWRAVPDCTANNFATLNRLYNSVSGNVVLADGNLTYTGSQTPSYGLSQATVGVSTNKWYWEVRVGATGPNLGVGVVRSGVNTSSYTGNPETSFISGVDGGIAFYHGAANTIYYWTGTAAATVSYTIPSCTTGDVISVALDLTGGTNSKIYFAKNGTWGASGDPATGTNPVGLALSGTYLPAISIGAAGASTAYLNFGQNPTFSGNTTAGTFTDSNGKGLFKYEPPSGFLALCEDNLPTPAIANPGRHFRTVLYTGDGSSGRSITGVGFTPDLVWIKERTSTSGHIWFDSVRGAGRYLFSVNTSAEGVVADALSSFDSDGFSIAGNNGAVNESSSQNYVAWCWRAGAGTTSTNTDGSITSVVSVNQDAGFSIVSYTGTASAATVGHGLGVSPSMIIVKNRDQADKWAAYHKNAAASPATVFLSLNETTAATVSSAYWNDTTPTSSVFTVGQTGPTNQIGENYVAYCWAEVEGFSKFGSYVGNGNADGPMVYTGGKPALILTKRTDTTSSWHIVDNARGSTNPVIKTLYPEGSYAEGDETNNSFDFLSNGFKIRGSSTGVNASGGTYIYACFMESPFTTANAK